jgi:uncharacterized protein YigE (DUF2233 family)
MRLIFLIFTLLSATVHGQVIVKEITNPNIGFGFSSECATNQYMDLVVNGPLLLKTNNPVGGYIDDGVLIQGWTKPEDGGGNFATGNGVMGLSQDGYLYMVPISEVHTLPKMKWAFQNGPMLVQNGRNLRGTSQTKWKRSGIGYKPDGTLVVIISITPITFRDFAELFVNQGCIDAIYLDGGPYVGYADKTTQNGLIAEAMKIQFFNN